MQSVLDTAFREVQERSKPTVLVQLKLCIQEHKGAPHWKEIFVLSIQVISNSQNIVRWGTELL